MPLNDDRTNAIDTPSSNLDTSLPSSDNLQGSTDATTEDSAVADWIIAVAVVGGILVLLVCVGFVVFAYKKGQQSVGTRSSGAAHASAVEMVTARQDTPSAPRSIAATGDYGAYNIGSITGSRESASSGAEGYGVLPASEGGAPNAYGVLHAVSDTDAEGYGPLQT